MTQSLNYSIPSTVILQIVDDETLLFDSKTELFFTLNETGTLMWEVISKNTSLVTVYKELLEMFNIPEKQLQEDLFAFTKALFEQGLFQTE